MKFLVFNLVVAGALVFLFTGEKGDLSSVADKAEQAISDVRTKISGAPAAKTSAAPVVTAKAPVAPPKVEGDISARSPKPAPVTATQQPKPAAQPLPKVDAAETNSIPPLPPEIEKRRTEVLDGTEETVASEGTAEKFMPADIRKRELMMLSEEMELFSARSISR